MNNHKMYVGIRGKCTKYRKIYCSYVNDIGKDIGITENNALYWGNCLQKGMHRQIIAYKNSKESACENMYEFSCGLQHCWMYIINIRTETCRTVRNHNG